MQTFTFDASFFESDLVNAPGEIRTHGPRIRNPVLYPTELRGHKSPRYRLLPSKLVSSLLSSLLKTGQIFSVISTHHDST